MFQLLKHFDMKRLITITLTVFLIALATVTNSQVVAFNHTYGQMPYNYGKKIIQANDGGYYILGNESGDIANTNIHIIRTDSLGIILFEKTIGDASVYSANDFVRTTDNGFLITGLTNKNQGTGYDVLLVKTDSNANVQWEKTYGGLDWDIGNSVIETFDNAYLISGQTFSYGSGAGNIYLIKTNFTGDTIWTKVFGGDSTDYATSATLRFDSTYLIGATTNSFGHGNFDGYVLNLKQNGDTLWTQTYGEEKEDIINSIKSTHDSGFVFVGSTMSYNAIEHDEWLMRFNKFDSLIWMLPEFWNILPGDEMAYSVNIDDSSHYVICGYTSSFGSGGNDLYFLLMGENNSFIHSLSGGFTGDDVGCDALKTSDGGFIMIGNTDGFGLGISNIYVIKIANNYTFSPTTNQISAIEKFENETKDEIFDIFPSISNGEFFVKLKGNNFIGNYNIIVTDLLGKIILHQKVYLIEKPTILLDLSDNADGLYFVSVYNEKQFACQKVIKQR
jgi:hypothetical protein